MQEVIAEGETSAVDYDIGKEHSNSLTSNQLTSVEWGAQWGSLMVSGK